MTGAATSSTQRPRDATAPVAVLAPRQPGATPGASRLPMRVLQTSHAPAQLSLFLRSGLVPR